MEKIEKVVEIAITLAKKNDDAQAFVSSSTGAGKALPCGCVIFDSGKTVLCGGLFCKEDYEDKLHDWRLAVNCNEKFKFKVADNETPSRLIHRLFRKDGQKLALHRIPTPPMRTDHEWHSEINALVNKR